MQDKPSSSYRDRLQQLNAILRSNARPARKRQVMLELAHDASDEALAILRDAQGIFDDDLEAFRQCAFDEGCFFNTEGKLDPIFAALDLLNPTAACGTQNELRAEMQDIEQQLGERGFAVSYDPQAPLGRVVSRMRLLLANLGDIRHEGTGIIVFDEHEPSAGDDDDTDESYDITASEVHTISQA